MSARVIWTIAGICVGYIGTSWLVRTPESSKRLVRRHIKVHFQPTIERGRPSHSVNDTGQLGISGSTSFIQQNGSSIPHVEQRESETLDAAGATSRRYVLKHAAGLVADSISITSVKTERKHPVRGHAYDMQGHTEASVQRYLELSGKHQSTLHPVATPCMDDHLLDPADDDTKCVLKEESAKIMLKAPYLARYNRIDLLWAVNALAREVTKWTVNCDKRLHRLVCYMHFTSHLELQCWVGDRPEDIQLALFADASFASWLGDSKSTSGAVLCLMGQTLIFRSVGSVKSRARYRTLPRSRNLFRWTQHCVWKVSQLLGYGTQVLSIFVL